MNGDMGKEVVVSVALTVGAAGAAMAQTTSGPDLSNIISATATGTMSAGIVPTGTVKIMLNVMKWAVNRLVGFLR